MPGASASDAAEDSEEMFRDSRLATADLGFLPGDLTLCIGQNQWDPILG